MIVNLVFWGVLIGLIIWLLRRRRRARERAMGPVPLLQVQQPVYEVTEAQKPELYAVDSASKLPTAPPGYAYQLCYAPRTMRPSRLRECSHTASRRLLCRRRMASRRPPRASRTALRRPALFHGRTARHP